jgi:predicted ATPase/class 3 adenylate cyclase
LIAAGRGPGKEFGSLEPGTAPSYASLVTTCPACGAANREDARFCDSCGVSLTTEASTREERKVVTVLFADLVGFTQRTETMDPEDVRGLLQPYWQRLRSELERYGGTVEKFIGDAVMALFGAPVAHEDDPERAVRAALAIRDWVREEEDLQVRIAVNTGEALVLLGARPEEGEGMAAGDVVNTAARLQSAAPANGILVGETTWRATRDRIEYVDAASVIAKGKTLPLSVWEAIQARARVGMDLEERPSAPLVGREGELDALIDTFERARREREAQLVTLVGVPGIGKSRLIAELFSRIEDDPELVWWRQGRALPYGVGISFWALGEIVKAQAGIHENDAEETAAAKLGTSVEETIEDGERAWVLRHLEPLIGLGDDAPADRTEAFTAWRRYLEALAEQRPLVLVFEDLHWADDGLLDFVDHLAEWASGVPLLVLGSARPELMDRRPDWGGGKLNATTLALSPLDDQDAARVIAGVLEQVLLPAETQEALLERAGGNPLYAEQFARLYLERRSVEDLPLPEHVQGIIAARLDALPADEKRLLQDAAVLGKVFWSGGVAALTGFDGDAITTVLHRLERKGFVRRERRSAVAGELEYAFRHVLVREVAYGQVPRPGRVEKHVGAARWVEGLGRAEDHAELLAHHYVTALELARSAGNATPALVEQARVALRDAGDRAASLNSFAGAAAHYRSALELWPAYEADRGVLLLSLARMELYGGDTSGTRAEEAIPLLIDGDRPELAAEAEALAAEAAWHRGDGDAVQKHLARAMKLVESLASSRSKAWILSQASRYAMLAGRLTEAIAVGRRALEMATELNLSEIRIHALNNIGSARTWDQDDGGLQDLEASAALAEETNSPEVARAYNNLGSVHYVRGDVRKCFELEARAIAAAERFGLEALRRFACANLVGSQYRLGQWDEALAGAEEIVADTQSGTSEANAREVRAWIRLARGDISGATSDAERAVEMGRAMQDPQAVYPALSTAAYVYASAGDYARGRPISEEIVSRWHDLVEMLPFAMPGELAVAHMSLLGRERLAAALSSEKLLRSRWLLAARALVTQDFEQAVALYEQIGSLADVAITHLHAAETLVELGRRREADAHLQAALTFYRAVGASRYVARAETLVSATA